MEHDDLVPNYEESIEIMFAKLTIALIRTHRNLNTLLLCRKQAASRPGDLSELPSWVPNDDKFLTDPTQHGAVLFANNLMPSRKACFHPTKKSIANVEVSNDYRKLTLSGYDIGVIYQFESVAWKDGCIERALDVVTGVVSPKGDQRAREGFWRTLITDRAADGITRAKSDVEGVEFDLWWDMHCNLAFGMYLVMNGVERYNRAYYAHAAGRMMFLTADAEGKKGWVGLGHQALAEDDHVVLLSGAQSALVLRQPDGSEFWQFVGEAYVHGIMDGSLWEEYKSRGVEERHFTLV